MNYVLLFSIGLIIYDVYCWANGSTYPPFLSVENDTSQEEHLITSNQQEFREMLLIKPH